MDKSTSNQPDSKSRSVDARASLALAPARKLPQEQSMSASKPMRETILALDVMRLGPVDRLGYVWLHSATDLNTCYVFGRVDGHAEIDTVQALLEQHVLPHYQARGCAIHAVTTEHSDLWHGQSGRAFQNYLMDHGIGYKMAAVDKPLIKSKIECLFGRLALLKLSNAVHAGLSTVTMEAVQAACDLVIYRECNRHIVD